jgi:hypothetical protein
VPGGWRLLLIAGAALAAVVLFVVFQRDDDDTATSPPPPPPPAATTIEQQPPPPPPPPADRPQVVRVNAASGTLTRATVARGKQVILVVTGPAGEEVHLHGYDIFRDIPAGGTVRLPFRATIPGRFEVELEESATQIADITVR